MAINKKTSWDDEPTMPDSTTPEYTIDVVQRIGAVEMGYDGGEHPPLRVAFMIISDHFAEAASPGDDQFEYRITHPSDGHQFTVTVEDPAYENQQR